MILAEAMRAATQGARSLHVHGWMGEEMEQAAIEAIVRHPPVDGGQARTRGRSAALDEFRRLTRYNRRLKETRVPLQLTVELLQKAEEKMVIDVSGTEERLMDWAGRQPNPARCRRMVGLLLAGYTQRDVARILHISESRVSMILHRRAA